MVYKFGITTSEDKIINIKNKNDKRLSHFLGVDNIVRMTPKKARFLKKAIHFGIPSPRSLPETIKGFLKSTYKAGVYLYEASWLFHIDFFMQFPMQEGIFNIHLMYFPFERGSKEKNKADRVHFGNKGEGFSVVNSFNL